MPQERGLISALVQTDQSAVTAIAYSPCSGYRSEHAVGHGNRPAVAFHEAIKFELTKGIGLTPRREYALDF